MTPVFPRPLFPSHPPLCFRLWIIPPTLVLAALVAQSCPTPCDPKDCSPSGSSAHGIILARILDWIANFFSRGFSQPGPQTRVSCIAGRFFPIWATGNNPWISSLPILLSATSLVSPYHLPQDDICQPEWWCCLYYSILHCFLGKSQ